MLYWNKEWNGTSNPSCFSTFDNNLKIRCRHSFVFQSLLPCLQVHKMHILLKGVMPHIYLPLFPLEGKWFSVSVVRDLVSKLQLDCKQVLFIPICSKANTGFWIKWHFCPVFSIMVMLKQSSLSAFPLLWKTTSSGFHSLDQVSLYPWINLVTFHWIGDALKASLILWRRNEKNISQCLPEMPHQFSKWICLFPCLHHPAGQSFGRVFVHLV